MERVGDRGYLLSAEEIFRLINQASDKFNSAIDSVVSDTGDGVDGSREFIFPDLQARQQFEKLCQSVQPPVTVAKVK